jgi:UDP-N-acetylmuramoyl-tripeptide--D-alanyl-D-alanine ligase
VQLDDLGRPSFAIHAGGESAAVSLPLSGAHHVGNALAAAAVALECGMGLRDAAGALSEVTARSRWRMDLRERPDGVVIINDAYNANPESMRAALEALAALGRARAGRTGRTGRTWAVLGPMAELGAAAHAEHDTLGRLAARLAVGRVVAVGEQARPIVTGVAAQPVGAADSADRTESTEPTEPIWVPDADAALDLLRSELQPGDIVLVKASRAAGLERVALALDATPEARQ